MFILTDLPRIDPQILNSTIVNRHIAEFRTSLRADPSDETARYGLGVAYFNLGLLSDSARELELAAQLRPENPHIQTQLAAVYERLAASADSPFVQLALDRVNRALLVRPGMPEALLVRAKLSLTQQRYANAVFDWSAAAASDPDAIRLSVSAFLRQHTDVLLTAQLFAPDRRKSLWALPSLGIRLKRLTTARAESNGDAQRPPIHRSRKYGFLSDEQEQFLGTLLDGTAHPDQLILSAEYVARELALAEEQARLLMEAEAAAHARRLREQEQAQLVRAFQQASRRTRR